MANMKRVLDNRRKPSYRLRQNESADEPNQSGTTLRLLRPEPCGVTSLCLEDIEVRTKLDCLEGLRSSGCYYE